MATDPVSQALKELWNSQTHTERPALCYKCGIIMHMAWLKIQFRIVIEIVMLLATSLAVRNM